MNILVTIRDYLKKREIYSRTVRELHSYSDRELRDIGIDRADIESIARQAMETYD